MSIQFTHFSHDDLVAGIHALADAAADWAPTLLVGVGRGGLAPAVYLSHRSGLPLVSIDYSTKIPAFRDELLKALSERSRAGERLLVIEDINDSGKTIGEIRASLGELGSDMTNVRFAVLLNNIRSSQQIDYRFRDLDRHVQKDWFVFPWEAMANHIALTADAMDVPSRIA